MSTTGPEPQRQFAPSAEAERYFCTDHLEGDLKGHTVRGAAVTLTTQACRLLLNVGSTAVLARLLAPADFGLLFMVTAITGLVVLFRDLGFSMATIQRDEINHRQVTALFWANVALSALAALLVAGIAPIIAWYYREARLTGITQALAVAFVFSGIGAQHQAILRRQMRFGALAAVEIASFSLGVAVAIVSAWYGAGYWALVFLQLSTALGGGLGMWVACSWRPGLPSRGSGVRAMLAFGGYLAGFNLANFIARNLDRVLIGRRWGGHQVGLYGNSYRLVLLPIYQINTPVAAVSVPALSRLVGSPERYREAYLRILEKVAMITMPGVALMLCTADWLVALILGPQWTGAVRIFMFLCVAAFAQPLANTVGWLFITQGRTRELLCWGLIGGGISIAAVVAGLPWGAVGVAGFYSISGLLIRTPLLLWYVGRSGPVRMGDLYRTVAPFLCASLSALLALLAFRRLSEITSPAAGLALALAITAAITFLVLWVQPTGRRALLDFRGMFDLLIAKKEDEQRGAAVKHLHGDD